MESLKDLYNDPKWAKISAIKNKSLQTSSAVLYGNVPSAESAVLLMDG